MRKFIFPITTGRSGTVFLTELLRQNLTDAEVHHERLGYTSLGVDTPDASHYTLFNSVGNVARVRDYWKMKMARIVASPQPAYAEISHFLFKAGLVENLGHLLKEGEVHLILLTRDVAKIHWSYVNRHEFTNNGYTWLFSLDANYPNVLVPSASFQQHNVMGRALWYVHEVFARMEYYAQMLQGLPNLKIHRVDLSDITKPDGAAALLDGLGATRANGEVIMPARQNASKAMNYPEQIKEQCAALVERMPLQSAQIAQTYLRAGRQLAFAGLNSKSEWARVNARHHP